MDIQQRIDDIWKNKDDETEQDRAIKVLLADFLRKILPERKRIGDPQYDGIVSDGEIEEFNYCLDQLTTNAKEEGVEIE